MTATYTDAQIEEIISDLIGGNVSRGLLAQHRAADMLRSLLTERKSALVQMQLMEVRTGADAQVEAWMSSTSMRIRKAFGAFDDPNKDIETIARELAERHAGSSGDGNALVTVSTQGVQFGPHCWMSHEKITGCCAEYLNNPRGVIVPKYMAWVTAALQPPHPPIKESVREVSSDSLVDAAKNMVGLYSHIWDRADGNGVTIFGDSVDRFEDAFDRLRKSLEMESE